MRNIWIWNHYAATALYDRGGRHYYFSKYLSEAGYLPTIFCANTMHNTSNITDIQGKLYLEQTIDGMACVFVKSPPYKGNGFSRIKNMLYFAKNVMRTAEHIGGKGNPDVILASSVHPFTCVAGILTARKFDIPCIVEIRDLWPESIVAYNKGSKANPIVWALYRLEKWIYKRADAVIFTMEGGAQYIRDKGWNRVIDINKIHHINNGVCLEEFDKQVYDNPIEDADLENNSIIKIAYTGSIRAANGLDALLDAAKITYTQNPKVHFLVWGDGDQKDRLVRRVADEGITNVKFKGRVHKKHIAYILSKCDFNYMHVAESSVTKYGASLNKLFDYFASGKPVICDVKMGYDLIIRHNAGLATVAQDPKTVADVILQIANMDSEKIRQMGMNARMAASVYNYKLLTDKLIGILSSTSRA